MIILCALAGLGQGQMQRGRGAAFARGFEGRGRGGPATAAARGALDAMTLGRASAVLDGSVAVCPTKRAQLNWEKEQAELDATESRSPAEIWAQATAPISARPAPGCESHAFQIPASHAVKITANHFKLSGGPREIYHFDVEIAMLAGQPGEGPRRELEGPIRLNRAVITTLAGQENWGPRWAFDGRKNIYTPDNFLSAQASTYEVPFVEPARRHPTLFLVKIALASTVSVAALEDYVRGHSTDVGDQPQAVLQALDVILRQSRMDDPRCKPVGGAFFFPGSGRGAASSLGRGVQLWHGVQQSVRPADGGVTLNVDVAHAAVLEALPIPVLLRQALGIPESELGALSPTQHRRIRGLLRHKTVQLAHLGEVFKTVRGVTIEPARQLVFKAPEPLTVEAYYERKALRLAHPEWPCADVGAAKTPQWVPLELLLLAPGQRAPPLDGQQQREMVRATAARPRERRAAIQAALADAIRNDPVSTAFGLHIEPRMMQVEARILDPPAVSYGARGGNGGRPSGNGGSIRGSGDSSGARSNGGGNGSGRVTELRPDRGSWDLRDVRFIVPATLTSFGVAAIMPHSPGLEHALMDFMGAQLQELRGYGLQVPHPSLAPNIAWTGRGGTPDAAVRNASAAAETCFGCEPQIIFVMLHDTDADTYRAVKRASDSWLGVPSQCFVSAKAGVGVDMHRSKRLQYMGNLAMKINSKLGGINQIVRASVTFDEPLIILGADVAHPPPGSEEPSIAAVVASLDPASARFAARIKLQAQRMEVIVGMRDMVKELLVSFYQETRRIPTRIIMYRDGVSEGQFRAVKAIEIAAILGACSELPAIREGEPYYKPALTYIVVQKRHRTRLFPEGSAGDKHGNPLPGTIVDRDIVRPAEFSFFLNSHAGLQGTSSPSLYHVLLDLCGFGMEQLQRFTYDLCYQFQRATKAVSVAPPAYYAHLAAERGRCLVAEVVATSQAGSSGRRASVTVEWAELNSKLARTTFFI